MTTNFLLVLSTNYSTFFWFFSPPFRSSCVSLHTVCLCKSFSSLAQQWQCKYRLQKKPRLLSLVLLPTPFSFEKKKKKSWGQRRHLFFFVLSLFIEWRNLPHPFSPTTTTTHRVYFCFSLHKSFRLDSISVAFYNSLHFSRCACDLFVCLFVFSFLLYRRKTKHLMMMMNVFVRVQCQ